MDHYVRGWEQDYHDQEDLAISHKIKCKYKNWFIIHLLYLLNCNVIDTTVADAM